MDLIDFSIGDVPIKILDIETKFENDEIIIDFVASYHGNALIQIDLVTGRTTEIPAQVTDIQLKDTKMRIILGSFDSEHPFGVPEKFAFMEDPIHNFSCDIHNLAGIPLFEGLVISTIKKQIRKKAVLPAMISCWNFKKNKSEENSEEAEEPKSPKSAWKKKLNKKNKKRNTVG